MFTVVPIINSTGLAIVAEADLRCGEFLSEKKLSSQIGSFHQPLVLATECFFSFDISEKHSDTFWVVNALWVF